MVFDFLFVPRYYPTFFYPLSHAYPYQTHKIFVFHPAVAGLHNLEVTSPWKAPNPMYPPPHDDLLKAHFQTSILASLSATAEPLADDDDDYDESIPAEVSHVPNDALG
jgi:hypothetical protein